MPRQFVLECRVDLPDDVFEQNEIITKVKDPWSALISAMSAGGVTAQLRSDIVETRARKAKDRPPLAEVPPAAAE